MVSFFRRTGERYSKLGKGRKKKQTWRKPTGRHNKMRLKRKGYPAVVSVGYKSDNKSKETFEGKSPVMVYNVKDLEKVKKNNIAIVGKIGIKKKIEIVKKVKEEKILVHNINVDKFLKEIKKKEAKKQKKVEEKPKEKIKEKKK